LRVLIVEDEADTLQLMTVYFEAKGHVVMTARDGVEALETFRAASPELVLLDIRIPRLDGWKVLEAIRFQSKVPVMLLTALDSAEDAVRGLDLGADDYLRKPFQLSELESRIQALFRRIGGDANHPVIQAGPFLIDDRAKAVTLQGEPIPLSPKEYELLKLLAADPGRVFSNQEIIAKIWPEPSRANVNDVKQYIHLLRSKICEDPSRPRWLETVKGFGYKLVV
jgi:two-component system OmpR family response regulator